MKSVIFHGIHLYCPINAMESTLVREMIRILLELKADGAIFNMWADDKKRDGAWFPASVGIPGEKALVVTIDIALPVKFHETGNLETRMSPHFTQGDDLLAALRGVAIHEDAKRLDERRLLHDLATLMNYRRFPNRPARLS